LAVAQATLVAFDDARVAAGPLLEARGDFGKEFHDHHGRIVVLLLTRIDGANLRLTGSSQPRHDQAAGVQGLLGVQCRPLGQGDQLFHEWPHGLGFLDRGDDPLVTEQRQGQVPVKRQPMRGVAIQFISGSSVSHGGE